MSRAAPLSDADRAAIEAEIADLDNFATLATSIEHNAKGKAFLKALAVAFKKATELGAAQKAIIFTESRRTQSYLLRVLADSPFGTASCSSTARTRTTAPKAIYAAWFEHHQGTDRVTGSRSADMRSALVDYFREQGRIMIATEAGAEGINLQFCSLVVNYDLPWNPQRIEQRIGRCHRYGQKHDVVVVNFLNPQETPRTARVNCCRKSSSCSKACLARATRCSAQSKAAWTSRSASTTSTSAAASTRRSSRLRQAPGEL